jgi:hypothetical protein
MSQSSSSNTSEYFSVLLLVASYFYTSYDIFLYIVYDNLYVLVQIGPDDLVPDLLSINHSSHSSNQLDQFIDALTT